MNETVSLIVPVYRNPEWVRAAVNSAINQTYSDLEILLIDDGSPDGCGALCDDLARTDPRIRVFHQENGGVSVARNTGLAHARGERIAFLDSDDKMEPDHIASLVELMDETGADIVSTALIFYLDEEKHNSYEDGTETKFFTPQEAVYSMHLEGEFNGYLMNKLFRRRALSGVRFHPDFAIHEDMLFLWEAILNAEKIAYRNKHTYHYLCHSTSAMNQTFSPRFETSITAAELMRKMMKEHFPQGEALAEKTVLFATLSVANKRFECGALDQEHFRLLQKKVRENHSPEAFSYITGLDNRISYRCLKRSRILFEIWKRMSCFLKKIR